MPRTVIEEHYHSIDAIQDDLYRSFKAANDSGDTQTATAIANARGYLEEALLSLNLAKHFNC